MNTYFIIISAITNPFTDEKISLGLILSNDQQTFFNYSLFKLNSIRNLIGSEWTVFIKKYLKSIEKQVKNPKILDTVNKRYFDYLSVYNNNVIVFSEPKNIDIELNKKNFDALFKKFICQKEQQHKKQKNNIEIVKKSFIPKVKNHFTIDTEITQSYNPDITIPVKVDLIGKNERIVISQFFDLERKTNFVKSDFYDLDLLSKVFNKKEKKFLVSAEPDKKIYPTHHNLWTDLRNFDNFQYVDISEIEVIKEYAEKHGVQPLIF